MCILTTNVNFPVRCSQCCMLFSRTNLLNVLICAVFRSLRNWIVCFLIRKSQLLIRTFTECPDKLLFLDDFFIFHTVQFTRFDPSFIFFPWAVTIIIVINLISFLVWGFEIWHDHRLRTKWLISWCFGIICEHRLCTFYLFRRYCLLRRYKVRS